MKILNITKNYTYLCELNHEEIKIITDKKFHYDELKSICNQEKEINLLDYNKLSSNYDINQVNHSINYLKSAIDFLNNKKVSLENINSMKEDLKCQSKL